MKSNMILVWIFTFSVFICNSQQKLTIEDVQNYTEYFTIDENFQFSDNTINFFTKEARNNQFIGIAEVHQSEQLSYFTTAFLKVLKKEGYSNLALEIGAHSADLIENLSENPDDVLENLKQYNLTYGKKSFPFIPFIFMDKVADARFIEEAARQGYDLWGIDREYEFSYVMHLDELFNKVKEKTPEIKKAYEKSRNVLSKVTFKDKTYGEFKVCWLLNEPNIQEFFALIDSDKKLANYINEIKNSWRIYCRFLNGKGGSNVRAKYMRKKFDSLYNSVQKKDQNQPKVLLKLGGVHLTHGNSQYGRYDVGRHVHEKAKENNTGFLTIRHVWRYKNGSDQISKKAWKNTSFLMQLGEKDKWTLIDLRPLKKKLEAGEITVDKGTAWELKSYDLFLISPNDSKGKVIR